MKKLLCIYMFFFFWQQVFSQSQPKIIEYPAMKSIFEKYGMKGTILIVDKKNNELIGYQPALWDSGYLPASTFKIPNTLIGLETGAIDTGIIFKWDGQPRRLAAWEKDLSLAEAFRVSCVPCYQEVARKINAVRMKNYVNRLNYGRMDVHQDNIDLFWLEGKSRITPRQQADFLERLYEEKLPLSVVMKTVKAIMIIEKTPDYILSGKTGWAIRNGNNYGWFVGWLEVKDRIYFVATLIEPENQQKISDFSMARKTISMDAFRMLKLIP